MKKKTKKTILKVLIWTGLIVMILFFVAAGPLAQILGR